MFKLGFIEQFEPIGNLLCDPHPTPAVGGRHLPPRGRQARGNGSFPSSPKLCFSFGFNEKNGFRIPLPSPGGKVPTSSAAGGG